jgi:hypothetical protein
MLLRADGEGRLWVHTFVPRSQSSLLLVIDTRTARLVVAQPVRFIPLFIAGTDNAFLKEETPEGDVRITLLRVSLVGFAGN